MCAFTQYEFFFHNSHVLCMCMCTNFWLRFSCNEENSWSTLQKPPQIYSVLNFFSRRWSWLFSYSHHSSKYLTKQLCQICVCLFAKDILGISNSENISPLLHPNISLVFVLEKVLNDKKYFSRFMEEMSFCLNWALSQTLWSSHKLSNFWTDFSLCATLPPNELMHNLGAGYIPN